MDIRRAVGVKAGIPVEKLNALDSYQESPHFTAREKAALEFSERITRDDLKITDECFAKLREHFTEPEIIELTFINGFQTFACKFAKAFQIAPQGYSEAASDQRSAVSS